MVKQTSAKTAKLDPLKFSRYLVILLATLMAAAIMTFSMISNKFTELTINIAAIVKYYPPHCLVIIFKCFMFLTSKNACRIITFTV